MANATHKETNEVSIKDILGPSGNASAFRPSRAVFCSHALFEHYNAFLIE